MSTPTQTHTERLAEIRERLEALTGVPAFSAVGNCYREDIPYLLERLERHEVALEAMRGLIRIAAEDDAEDKQIFQADTLRSLAIDALSAAERALAGLPTTHPENIGTPLDPDWKPAVPAAQERL